MGLLDIDYEQLRKDCEQMRNSMTPAEKAREADAEMANTESDEYAVLLWEGE